MITVDHLNTFVGGGAATAAMRIHRSLVKANVDSRFWYGRRHQHQVPEAAYPVQWPRSGRIWQRLASRGRKQLQRWQLRRGLPKHACEREIFSLASHDGPTRFDRRQFNGDILQLHWISRMLDYRSFFATLPDQLPVIWTLHDMNAFTGGCHFSGGCEAFVTQCQHCPQLGRCGEHDLSNRLFHLKHESLAGKNLHIVAPSHWLCQQARRSRILSDAKSFRVIHYGLDIGQFAPVEKSAAKKQLGIPADRFVIGFGAASVENQRKGFRYLQEALGQLAGNRRVLGLVFGSGRLSDFEFGLPEIRSVGFIHDPARQSLVYSAADVFVLPSLEDNSPQTGLEALACETPVVGFRAGGIPDFVRPMTTGLLADVGDASGLGSQIEWLLQNPARARQFGRNGRQLIRDKFESGQTARQYIDLYESLLHQARLGRSRSPAA